MGYYNSDNYREANLQGGEEKIRDMIRKITKMILGDFQANIPELAFLPLVLEMSSGLFDAYDNFLNDSGFYLRVARNRRMMIFPRGGSLKDCRNFRIDNYYYPARDFS